MDSQDLFLSCNNMTLPQYRAVTLARSLTGAAGCIVSLAVLGTVLTRKKKAWETISKRLYFAVIFYVLLYSILAIAAVNYSHPPTQETKWCEALAYLLHYSGTLVVVQYLACAVAVMLQVTVPAYQALKKGSNMTCLSPTKAKLGEALLFLTLFLSPVLNTWEPFLHPWFAPYGNYGPLCWFRLELTDNCTANTTHTSDINALYLQTIPFAVVCFIGFALTFMTLVALCGMYCKFRMRTTGTRIGRVIPPMVVLIFVIFMMGAYFTITSVTYKSFNNINSFSAWLRDVTVTLAVAIGLLGIVGVYVHFPMNWCLYQKSSVSTQPSLQNPTIRTSHARQAIPSHTVTYLAHETVTTTEASPLISKTYE